jgi:hypothetical protein
MFQGLFVDDREDESVYARHLSVLGENGLNFVFLKAELEIVQLANTILARKPDIVAMDYRLDDQQNLPNRYKANPLAQHLRDHAVDSWEDDFPIILVSHEQKIKEKYHPDRTAHDLFDHIYIKEELVRTSQSVARELLGLVEGYRLLKGCWSSGNRVRELLGANDQQVVDVHIQEIRHWEEELQAPHLLARRILRYLIRRSGILVDQNGLLALMGVKPDSADVDKLIQYFERECKYTGAFSKGWDRWWASSIRRVARDLCGEEIGNLTAQQRIDCLNGKLSLRLIPAASKWTNGTDTFPIMVCASCNYPTDRAHSVAVHETVPSFVQRRRVCWKCVSTGDYEHHEPRLDLDEKEDYIVAKLKRGDIKRSG